MFISIVNNVEAQKLTRIQNELRLERQQITTRLTTGLRINTAGDDAAGMSQASVLEAQIRGYAQGNLNILDGVALLRVAGGGLSTAMQFLQRIRKLALQAANGTITDLGRQALQTEVQQILQQLRKIAEETKFDDVSLLNRGQIQSIDFTLGQLQQLTFGGDDERPSFSPDGTKVAFGRNNDIWVKDLASGAETQLTTAAGYDNFATWSPDGSQIAFTSDRAGSRDIWVMSSSFANWNRVTNKITFSSDRTGDPFYDLFEMNPDGTGKVQKTAKFGWDYQAAYSKDGTQVAYTSDGGTGNTQPLSILDANAAAASWDPGSLAAFTGFQMEQPAWTPQGDFVGFKGAKTDIFPFDYGIYMVRPDGSTALSPSVLVDFPGSNEEHPDFDPDGNVVFSSDTTGLNLWSGMVFRSTRIKGETISIQVGPQTGNVRDIELTNIRPEVLGIAGLDISTEAGAKNAVTSTDQALQITFSESAKMGGQENALQHLSEYTAIAGEEITQSKSRIADADMAKEAADFAKNLILSQSAQAMESQANARPTLVLDLLSDLVNENRAAARGMARTPGSTTASLQIQRTLGGGGGSAPAASTYLLQTAAMIQQRIQAADAARTA
ncbi:MAG: PD40 domain-containing protein [Armatimonadetes bacterium]|nr:PD40 domain-containing protein [Armatimonadota bacterium]